MCVPRPHNWLSLQLQRNTPLSFVPEEDTILMKQRQWRLETVLNIRWSHPYVSLQRAVKLMEEEEQDTEDVPDLPSRNEVDAMDQDDDDDDDSLEKATGKVSINGTNH